MSRKVIINCAVTGSIHVPSLSPYLPITPEQITSEAVAAAEAGAATVHLHARDPETGRPDMDPELFHRFCRKVHEQSDTVICITTGGAPTMTPEERMVAVRALKPELAKSNADLVAKIRRIITELSFEIAGPDEARKMLGLKGKEQTSY